MVTWSGNVINPKTYGMPYVSGSGTLNLSFTTHAGSIAYGVYPFPPLRIQKFVGIVDTWMMLYLSHLFTGLVGASSKPIISTPQLYVNTGLATWTVANG